jgi:hypothetical protein
MQPKRPVKIHELAGERDLRQHDQRLPALVQRGDGLEVHLGSAEPVTPSSSVTENAPASTAARMACTAAAC